MVGNIKGFTGDVLLPLLCVWGSSATPDNADGAVSVREESVSDPTGPFPSGMTDNFGVTKFLDVPGTGVECRSLSFCFSRVSHLMQEITNKLFENWIKDME